MKDIKSKTQLCRLDFSLISQDTKKIKNSQISLGCCIWARVFNLSALVSCESWNFDCGKDLPISIWRHNGQKIKIR